MAVSKNKSNILKNQTIQRIVAILKNEFTPEKIYFFGSRANGKATKNSDYDFVLVTKKIRHPSRLKVAQAKMLIFSEVGVSVDLFVYTQKNFSEWEDSFNSIPETAKNTGIDIPL